MYGGFHVKWVLFLSEFSQKGNATKTFVTITTIRVNFHEYLSDGSRLVPYLQKDRRTDSRTKVQINLTKVVDLLA